MLVVHGQRGVGHDVHEQDMRHLKWRGGSRLSNVHQGKLPELLQIEVGPVEGTPRAGILGRGLMASQRDEEVIRLRRLGPQRTGGR